MPAESHIQQIFNAISTAVAGFDDSIPAIQRDVLNEVEELLRGLDITSGRIAPSIANLKKVARAQGKLERIVLENDQYASQVGSYLDTFGRISDLNAAYFQEIERNFSPSSLLKEMQKQSTSSTLSSLTGAGISANITEPVYDLIQQNITTGTKFTDLVQSLRDHIVGEGDTLGSLDRYVKQITTDALNQYSAQYMDIVSADLNMEWAQYAGVRIETSRAFCVAMLRKKYYHKKEIPDMIRGNFSQFREVGGTLYKQTGLPHGMVKGTNTENFPIYRGGYQCHHQPIPISESSVPARIRREVYAAYGIKTDAKGMRSSSGSVPAAPAPAARAKSKAKPKIPVIKFGFGDKFDKYIEGINPDALRVIDKIRKPSLITDGVGMEGGSRYFNEVTAVDGKSGTLLSRDSSGKITFRHEYGHHIDYNVSKGTGEGIRIQRSLERDFIMASREDMLSIKKKYKAKGMRVDQMYEHLAKEWNTEDYAGASDMLDAFSGGLVHDRYRGWGHGRKYYKTTQKQQAELFANLFEGYSTGGAVWKNITEHFPALSELFVTVMQETIK